MGQNVRFDSTDRVTRITLNRPEKLNAMTPSMWRRVGSLIEQAERDRSRMIVLSGQGEAFCAGDDITTLNDIESEHDVRSLCDVVLECFDAIESSPLPVIGKANGSAYGGGFELLLCCDLTVVPSGSVFSLPETQIGAYPFYAAKRLVGIVGRQRASDISMAGRELTAEEAVEWGLFARVVNEGDVDSSVEEIIDKLKRSSPGALETTKAWSNAQLEFVGENTAMKNGLGYLFAGEDAREGARSFLENRNPDFAE